MNKITRCLVFLGFVFSPFICWAQVTEPLTLKFGVYTSTKPSEMIDRFTPVMKALEAELKNLLQRPVSIQFQVAAKYQDGIRDIAESKVDFSRMGPASYIEASQANPGIHIVAVESKGGATTDFGIICVKEDSPIKEITDLKGKTFAFGDEMSTIGRYLSQLYLLTHGVKAADLKGYEYLGRHDAVAAAVGAGRFDAGAVKEETFSKLKKSGAPLRELARFPNASQAWVVKKDFDPKVQEALKQSLLNFKAPEVLKGIDADKFVEGSEKDFVQVKAAMAANPEFFKR